MQSAIPARLQKECAASAGEVMGCYVPQAVVKDSTVLDVDLVLSEVVEDGELLLVEYNCGPEAYTTRYTAAQMDTQNALPCAMQPGHVSTLCELYV
jgi:hypothetical protein